MKKKYDIAAYVWPAYHYEPRMEKFWPEKDGEWYTVRRGKSKFSGHDMPRIPLLGYQNEAAPDVMHEHIDLAMNHGVNVFIVDWYWYEEQPCFERQLNDGLIPAATGTDMKFYLMWANHDADMLWNMHSDGRELIWDGKVSRSVFESMMERVIDKYFMLDNYYCIDNKPVFSIFSPENLILGLGGIAAVKDAFKWLRCRVIDKGLPGLHLQFIIRRGKSSGPEATADVRNIPYKDLASILEVDSGTSYQFVGDTALRDGDYVVWANEGMSKWVEDEKNYPMLFPHVSIGWDNTQRNPSIKTAVTNSTPFAFEACLYKAKRFVDTHPQQPPLITVNSWNEWTEGSYLLPDMRWGYAYLEAIRKVFIDGMY